MWYNHSLHQKNKTSKITVEGNVGGNGEEGFDKILKSWGRNIRGLYIIEGVRNTLATIPRKSFSEKRMFYYFRKNP